MRPEALAGAEPAPVAGSPGTPEITVSGVSKRFVRRGQETLALEGVDLAIGRGEFLAVVGPSGCGKSTLLRIVAGLLPPSTGEVRVQDRRVTGPQTDFGIVFQRPNLVEWRTVLGNVLLPADLRGDRSRELADRARLLLDVVGLGEFLNAYPHELSGGMQQRAAIARALLHRPATLLMDEPFGALDALTREQMRVDLEALWLANRMTIVLITHSVDEAILLADRVVVMSARPGRIDRVYDVPLARPRGLEARQDVRFARLTDEITQLFLSRGVLTARTTAPRLG